jgi:hypothetical protein
VHETYFAKNINWTQLCVGFIRVYKSKIIWKIGNISIMKYGGVIYYKAYIGQLLVFTHAKTLMDQIENKENKKQLTDVFLKIT